MNNDLVFRDDVLKYAEMLRVPMEHESYNDCRAVSVNDILAVPAVDAEVVRHGRWMPVLKSDIFGKEYEDGHRCSECGGESLYLCADYIAYDELSKYCPHCGAKMLEGVDVSQG